jgi:hypothetical protein
LLGKAVLLKLLNILFYIKGNTKQEDISLVPDAVHVACAPPTTP